MLIPEYIMIHHSFTEDSETLSWGAIRRYHIEVNGWEREGYHFGVELVKSGEHSAYEILKGRPLTMEGAHCREAEMNRKAIGICLVGNFDLASPPVAALEKLAELCNELMWIFNISKHNIVGHRDYATYKTCPGSKFDLDMLRSMLD